LPVSYFNTKWTTVYQFDYPDGWQEIKHGFGYWKDPVIEIIGEAGLCYWNRGDGLWTKYDPKHPRCGFCGKFVKAGNAWKYEGWTGPCSDCYENTRWM